MYEGVEILNLSSMHIRELVFFCIYDVRGVGKHLMQNEMPLSL